MKVREFYSGPEKWCQHRFTDEGGAMCLTAAISRCYHWPPSDWDRVNKLVHEAIGNSTIPHWNDDGKRTFEDVKALVDRLDI